MPRWTIAAALLCVCIPLHVRADGACGASLLPNEKSPGSEDELGDLIETELERLESELRSAGGDPQRARACAREKLALEEWKEFVNPARYGAKGFATGAALSGLGLSLNAGQTDIDNDESNLPVQIDEESEIRNVRFGYTDKRLVRDLVGYPLKLADQAQMLPSSWKPLLPSDPGAKPNLADVLLWDAFRVDLQLTHGRTLKVDDDTNSIVSRDTETSQKWELKYVLDVGKGACWLISEKSNEMCW